ncbi:hypothetical protein DAI22_11g186200 [Oryza sativa Japonica Group]|nr:hypothetical protein DAI22_11g186200 [Oryza sativa Japonica Group]
MATTNWSFSDIVPLQTPADQDSFSCFCAVSTFRFLSSSIFKLDKFTCFLSSSIFKLDKYYLFQSNNVTHLHQSTIYIKLKRILQVVIYS